MIEVAHTAHSRASRETVWRVLGATVTLSDAAGGGTDIHWESSFNPPWPIFGGLWRDGLQRVITDVADRAAAEADHRVS